MTTIKSVNEAVAAAGFPERLARGDGYFYWHGGDASQFQSSGVYVSHVSDLSIEQWIDDLKDKKARASR